MLVGDRSVSTLDTSALIKSLLCMSTREEWQTSLIEVRFDGEGLRERGALIQFNKTPVD